MISTKAFIWIKVGGLLTLIPIFLAVGPLAGYAAGDWLISAFGFPGYTTVLCVIIAFAAAVREVIRIIRLAMRAAREI
jgi:hypothetical protein